jgi:SAM-dependent methyltransferase
MSQAIAPVRSEGSAAIQGERWGARVDDWAEIQEPQHRPLYEEAIRQTGIGPGTEVLDVGCGAGVFCRLAVDLGARVSGLDAADAMIETARRRVPEAEFRVGDMQFLPYPDDTFDVVCGFTSFQLAADPVAALAEARRVARPGAPVAIFVWGRPERCDMMTVVRAWQPLMPPPPPDAPKPIPMHEPGVLEDLATRAGLKPATTGDLTTVWEYPDVETAVRAPLASAGGFLAIQHSGEAAVRAVTGEALAAFRTASGAYRLANEWHYLIATA